MKTADELARRRELERALEEAARAGFARGKTEGLRAALEVRAAEILEGNYRAAAALFRSGGIAGLAALIDQVTPDWTALRPLLGRIMVEASTPAAPVLGPLKETSWSRYLDSYVLELSRTLSETSREQSEEVIRGALEKGRSTRDAARDLEEAAPELTRKRAKLIARTETNNANRAGSWLQARDSGVVAAKSWRSVRDGKVRDEHRELDGETVGVDEPFPNGLMFPSEPNCRCYLHFEVSPELLAAG